LLAELHLTSKKQIVLRVEGTQLTRRLVRGDRIGHEIEGSCRVVQRFIAKHLEEEVTVLRGAERLGDGLDVGVGHLEGIQRRTPRLFCQIGRAPVPEQAAHPQVLVLVESERWDERRIRRGQIVAIAEAIRMRST
jgi:hypothetical protein